MILSILRLIPAIASLFFIGYPFAYLLLVKSRNAASESEAYQRYRIIYGRILLLIISFYIGALISGLYLLVISLTGKRYSFLQIVVFSSLFFICTIIIIIRHKRRLVSVSGFTYLNIENVKFLGKIREKNEKDKIYEQLTLDKQSEPSKLLSFNSKLKVNGKIASILNPVFIVLIIINILIVVFFALLFPIRFWDAISCWSLKAKAFFIDSTMADFYLKHDYSFSALSYPPFLSLLETWIYLWIGKIDENLVKIIFPIFYTSQILLVFNFFRKKFNETLSLILAYIFASIPVIVDHGYIEYSNMLFSILLFVAVYFFSSFISNEIVEINACSNKKKSIIEKVKMYIYERQNQITLDFKIHDNIESVFKNGNANPSSLNEKLNNNLNISTNSQTKPDHLDSNENKTSGPLKIDRLRKYSHLYLSTIFFGILALTRSEGIFYCALFLIISLVVYFYGLIKKSVLKGRFRSVLISIGDSFYSDKNSDWWKNINGKFIRNGDPPLIHLKLFLKKIFSPILLLAIIYLPWYLFKLKLDIPFASTEWQKALESNINMEFILNGLKRASGAFLTQIFYSSFDSTKAFFGSFYGPVLIILIILFFVTVKKAFTNGGLVFFLFTAMVIITSFVSIIFVSQFEGSIERYILPAFPLAYYWILTNAFKIKPVMSRGRMSRGRII
ncbi:MAG: hypothetical protein ACYCZ1_04135 [Candidatus Humimicrobiaceae bacterium]